MNKTYAFVVCLVISACTTQPSNEFRPMGQYYLDDAESSAQASDSAITSFNRKEHTVQQNEGEPESQYPHNSYQTRHYGDSALVQKVVDTVRIHCDKQIIKNNVHLQRATSSSHQYLQCSYQFPKHCGGHRFSLLKHQQKQILIYHDISLGQNIIDTFKGAPNAKGGLWDGNDHLAITRSNLNTLFHPDDKLSAIKAKDPYALGWLTRPDALDLDPIGERYIATIKEAQSCF